MESIEKVVIYGAGKIGKSYVDKCLSCGLEKTKLFITDSNSSLWGKYYKGLEIKSSDNVLTDDVDMVVISAGNKYKEEIAQKIKDKYHIQNSKIAYYNETLILPGGGVHKIDNMYFMNMNVGMLGIQQYYDMWYELYKMSLKGMNIGTGGDMEHDGELNVLKLLKSSGEDISVLFDVGANIGKYTKLLLSVFPESQIHCFEPAKETFCTLSNNIIEQNVILNNVGISNEIAHKTLYYDKENSGLASLYNRQLDYLGFELNKKEQIKLITLDYYCQSHGIDRIDFLKMDIEGNEYKALLGASGLLKEKKIGAIQIEMGGANMDSRTYFRDYWNLLHKDFDVFRILREGFKKIEKYEESLECFITTNWLFIKKG